MHLFTQGYHAFNIVTYTTLKSTHNLRQRMAKDRIIVDF
jgi:hypothetical protein